MIVKEQYKPLPDGRERVRYFSNANMKIRKVGTNEVYDEAIEFAETVVEYAETDINIGDVENRDLNRSEE